MTTYTDRERRCWRYMLRYLRSHFNHLSAMLTLALLFQPSVAGAGNSCPAGYIPISHGCRTPAGNSVACDAGYEGRFRKVGGRWVGRCAVGPIVWQP